MTTRNRTVVFAHDVESVRKRAVGELGRQGVSVLEASSLGEAIRSLNGRGADCVIVAELAAGMPETLRWMAAIHNANRAVRVVLAPSEDPAAAPDLSPRGSGEASQPMIGRSHAIRCVREYIEKVAGLSCSVLVTGETGTGKELVAQMIHDASLRCTKPLVALNCAAIPDALLESELFGVERGAYTGAFQSRDGRFVQADGGTLFLDEIGELSAAAQAKLLRTIETRRVERLGGSRTQTADVRIVAATNQKLWEMTDQGRFRKDLYFRLAVCQIDLPPLRERLEDLPLLCRHLLDGLRRAGQTQAEGFDDDLMDALRAYSWPGNIRELRNVLEAMTVEKRSGVLGREDLPRWLKWGDGDPRASARLDERRRLVAAMESAKWNKAAAARTLRVSRVTLYRKLAEHKIEGGARPGHRQAITSRQRVQSAIGTS